MFRWALLLGTFAVWLSCLALVYVHYGPHETEEALPGTESALEVLFSEHAEPVRAWRIYVDPQSARQIAQGLQRASAPSAWDGTAETNLLEVGWTENTLKRKNDARLQQSTELSITFPAELKIPLLEAVGELNYKSWSDISADEGVQYLSSALTTGIGLSVNSFGSRDGSDLMVTLEILQNNKSLLQRTMKIPVTGKAAPTLELAPFQPRPDLRPGAEWDIVMLDTSGGLGKLAEAKMVFFRARCNGRRVIRLDGRDVMSLEVQTAEGDARAWYSADGVVLKQTYRIAGTLEVMLVRCEPAKLRRHLRRARLPGAMRPPENP